MIDWEALLQMPAIHWTLVVVLGVFVWKVANVAADIILRLAAYDPSKWEDDK